MKHRYYNRFGQMLSTELRVIVGMYCLLLVLFSFQRLLLFLRNSDLSAQSDFAILSKSFLVGLRFDLAVSSYLLIPFFLGLLFIPYLKRVWLLRVFGLFMAVFLLIELSEIEFYHELEMRLNTLVFEYLSHPSIVAGMIWDGFPVVKYLLLWAVLATLCFAGVKRLHRAFHRPDLQNFRILKIGIRSLQAMLTLTIMIIAARGGVSHEPLRWGDAYFSQDAFANQLALNGLFTLGRSLLDKASRTESFWVKTLPESEATRTTRKMLLLPHETDLSNAGFPLLRSEGGGDTPALQPDGSPRKPVNVVVILMESFSARFVGAMGADSDLTPEFDRLCDEGVLFERAFSNGTHTHQGVFASLASFPNLPGYEYLMKMMEANQEFSGLPSLLGKVGYQSVFLYNGLFSWDNKEGFFRQHGIDRFIGTKDYINPTFVDPVWGVSDYDVFMRANHEFKAMSKQGPFFAAILTLSNHSPFNLPDPLPFERIESGDSREGRYNAMRYADWALGEFFRQAGREAYFENTLFVLTGDHGFGSPPVITAMELDKYHVPLLFYGPGVLKEKGIRRQTVASQVDIGPSVLGALGLALPHQSWGRNLFAVAPGDQGFAVIKPSGGEERVALVQGDHLLIEAPKEESLLYHYSLGFPPVGTPIPTSQEPERINQMERELRSYVETGILALRQRRIGLPMMSATTAEKRIPVSGETFKASTN